MDNRWALVVWPGKLLGTVSFEPLAENFGFKRTMFFCCFAQIVGVLRKPEPTAMPVAYPSLIQPISRNHRERMDTVLHWTSCRLLHCGNRGKCCPLVHG